MKGVKSKIKTFLKRFSLERIAAVLSICYVVGVVLLLQYNSIYFGNIDFDFIRIKPIIVGIEYFIYLGLPLVVVCVPMILTSKRVFGWFWIWFYRGKGKGNVPLWYRVCGILVHSVLYLLEVAILIFISGLMFHYFFPYTEYFLPNGDRFPSGDILASIMISCSFWRIYYCWDISLIGFFCLFVGAILSTCKFCKYIMFRSAAARRFYCIFVLIFIPIAFLTNMFYFLRDVYPNISQAAGGGAPVSGIITLDSPGEQLRHDPDGKVRECGEITKFCSVMQTTADFWFIDEQLIDDQAMMRGNNLRAKPTRVRVADIKQFTPLQIPTFYHNGIRHAFHQYTWLDFVHNIDSFVEFTFAAKDVLYATRGTYCFNTTNEVEILLFANKFPFIRMKTDRQRIMRTSVTNLCYKIEFRHLPIPPKTVVPEFMNAFTNKTAGFECVFRNLPTLPTNVVPVGVSFGFIINYNAFVTAYSNSLNQYDSVFTISQGAINQKRNDRPVRDKDKNGQNKDSDNGRTLDNRKRAVGPKMKPGTNTITKTTAMVVGAATVPKSTVTP